MTFTEDKKKQFESDELIEKIIAICADSLINEDDVAGLYIAGLRKELRKVIKPFKEAQEEAVRKFVRHSKKTLREENKAPEPECLLLDILMKGYLSRKEQK